MRNRTVFCLLLGLLGQSAALAQANRDPTMAEAAATRALLNAPAIDAGAGASPPLLSSFANPPPRFRPRIRYWVPQAAVTEAGIRRDVRTLAEKGFGAIELVSMTMPDTIPAEYGWGTPRWDRVIQIAADEAGRLGLALSIANGPSWPIAMPGIASADDPASLFELTYGEQLVEPGSRYTGPAPAGKVRRAEGSPKLVALLAYPVTGDRRLDPSRAVDLTGSVAPAGGALTFVPPTGHERWMLLSFWGQPAAQKVGPLYVIDHFSAEGARASADYWNRIFASVLKPGSVADIFNDSLEYKVTMDWTRDLPAIFRAQHGYALEPYLPFIGTSTTYPKNDIAGFASGNALQSAQLNQDYLDTLAALHIERHLAALQAMAARHGATIRYQVGYNKPLGIETAAGAVGIAETEALGRAAIDGMRQMAAAVHILGKPEYSVESAAEFGNGYGQGLRDILWWSKRAWAAGVNAETLHGAAYNGGYDGPGNLHGLLPGIEWPGYHPFAGRVTNIWNRETSPLFSRLLTAYLARGNSLLRRPARVDVAVFRAGLDVFNDPSVRHGDGEALHPDGGALANRGFSYDFVSPALLALPQSDARAGAIAPDGPRYRALLVPDARMISLADLARFETFAARGVRILFVGDLPRHSRSYGAVLRGETDDRIAAAVARLLATPGVAHVRAYDAVPRKLREMGVRPDADALAGSGVLAQHRVEGPCDLYYLYNYNRVSSKDATAVGIPSPERTSYPLFDAAANLIPKTVRFSLAGKGRPYLLNSWSGAITPIPAYTVRRGRIELTLKFKGDEALFVALMDDRTARAGSLKPASRHAGADRFANDDLAYERGRLVSRQPLRQAQSAIASWKLTVESLARPEGGASAFAQSERSTLGPFAIGERLRPLREISPALRDRSGVATYRSLVTLPPSTPGRHGYLLDLGRVEGAVAVSVNGRQIEGADQLNPVLEIGAYLGPGVNEIRVSVATTLCGSVNCDPERDEGLLGTDGRVYLRGYRAKPRLPGARVRRNQGPSPICAQQYGRAAEARHAGLAGDTWPGVDPCPSSANEARLGRLKRPCARLPARA